MPTGIIGLVGTDRRSNLVRTVTKREAAAIRSGRYDASRNKCTWIGSEHTGELVPVGHPLEDWAIDTLTIAAVDTGLDEPAARRKVIEGLRAGQRKPRDLGDDDHGDDHRIRHADDVAPLAEHWLARVSADQTRGVRAANRLAIQLTIGAEALRQGRIDPIITMERLAYLVGVSAGAIHSHSKDPQFLRRVDVQRGSQIRGQATSWRLIRQPDSAPTSEIPVIIDPTDPRCRAHSCHGRRATQWGTYRALAADPCSSARGLVETTGQHPGTARKHLVRCKSLGLAERSDLGTWQLRAEATQGEHPTLAENLDQPAQHVHAAITIDHAETREQISAARKLPLITVDEVLERWEALGLGASVDGHWVIEDWSDEPRASELLSDRENALLNARERRWQRHQRQRELDADRRREWLGKRYEDYVDPDETNQLEVGDTTGAALDGHGRDDGWIDELCLDEDAARAHLRPSLTSDELWWQRLRRRIAAAERRLNAKKHGPDDRAAWAASLAARLRAEANAARLAMAA